MSLRKASQFSTAAPKASQPSRRRVVLAVASTEVPPNVAEARAWIANWRSKQGAAPAAAANGNGTAAAAKPAGKKAAAAAPAKAAGGKFGAASSMADGTLVFTADQLQSVDYADVNLAGKAGKKK